MTNPFHKIMDELDRQGWAQGNDNVMLDGADGPICVGIAFDRIFLEDHDEDSRQIGYELLIQAKDGCCGRAIINHNDLHLKTKEEAYEWLTKAATLWEESKSVTASNDRNQDAG